MKPNIRMGVLAALLALCAVAGRAQDVYIDADLETDDYNNVTAWASISADYYTAYYYSVVAEEWIYFTPDGSSSSSIVCSDSQGGVSYAQANCNFYLNQVGLLELSAVQDLFTTYYVYQVNSGCSWDCYYYDDQYGYSFISSGGNYPNGQVIFAPDYGQEVEVTQVLAQQSYRAAQAGQGNCSGQNPIITEYMMFASTDITTGQRFVPQCAWFTQSASSVYFGYSELAVNDPYAWALVKFPETVSEYADYGLDYWRYLLGGPQIINSGYRPPAYNYSVGGANNSRHMFGDAIDIRNSSRTSDEYVTKACRASTTYTATYGISCSNVADSAAGYVEPLSGPCGYGCVHADWRNWNRDQYVP